MVTGFLLNLPDHHTLDAPIKSINISVFKDKFPLLISGQNFNTTNDIARINSGKILPYFIFEHYSHRGLCFLKLSLYEYYRVISVVKRKRKQEGDYKFDDTYTQKEIILQQYFDKKKQLALVTLRGNLSNNEKVKDIISGGHLETNTC